MKLKDSMNQEIPESEFPDPEYDERTPMPDNSGIARLATALAKAQGELQDADKDKQGYGYNYADLSQVLSIGRPILSKHGLCVVQLLNPVIDNKVSLTTIMMHESGESITATSDMPIVSGKNIAQSVGATCTYLRRYAYSAMVGITQADSDAAGETQSAKPPAQQPAKTQSKRIRADPAVLRHLSLCEDMETLKQMWAKIPKTEHNLYQDVKEMRKSELLSAQADHDQESL